MKGSKASQVADMLEQAHRRPKRLRWRRLVVFAALALLAAIGAPFWLARSFTAGPMPPSIGVVSKLPITLPNGQQAPLGQLIRPGLPTVISLWASWCGPCQLEAPHIVALRRRFGPDKLNLVYLNVREDGASPEDLARFLRSIGMPPNDYVSMRDADLPRLTSDSRNLIPRTFVFDKAGTPIAMIVGYKPMALERVSGLLSDQTTDR